MRKMIAIAALAALCACADNDAADEATPAATETPDAAAAEGPAGTYEYEMDGVATVAMLNADGTYTDTQAGEVVESGTWVERDERVCFDPDGEPPEVCWTSTEPDAEGVFTATSDDGTTLTIKRTS